MDVKTGPVTRDAIPDECKWDLTDLFSSVKAWEDALTALESEIKGYSAFHGTLGETAGRLRACLEFDTDCARRMDRIYTYAHLKNDEDKTNSLHQGNFDRAVRLATRAGEARSFIAAELMAAPPERMRGFLEEEALAPFKLHLQRILRYRPHTLSEQGEALLASSMEVGRATREVFGLLNNADLKLGTVRDEDGGEIAITHGNFQMLMQSYDRRVRREAFAAFYGEYQDHQFTFAALLGNSIKKDIFYARSRHYPSVREQALFAENVGKEVYDNLIDAVRAHLKPLHKYFALRKRALGLSELRVYDCAVPLAKDVAWSLSYPGAVEKIQAALAPLGGEYMAVMAAGLERERWVDRYENKGKCSGAYSSGCYGSRPYILMNFREDDVNSIYTLAHEAGHSMHSFYAHQSQPYLYAGYTIFEAEVASTFNEALLTRHLLAQDMDKNMRLYLLCREIDNFRGTLYRQTMFAEFEREIYALAEKGSPLTVDTFKEVYKKLLETYFGKDVIIDEQLLLECFRIPHFYSSFYVYKYATGISAAYSLAEKVLAGGDGARQGYLRFLGLGGSLYPLDSLRQAGVDMASPQPVSAALRTFSSLVDQLECLLNSN